MEGHAYMIVDKGHFRAVIDADDLDDVQVSVTMGAPLDTCEALLAWDEAELMQEFRELRLMINDYVNYLYQLREEKLAYAV